MFDLRTCRFRAAVGMPAGTEYPHEYLKKRIRGQVAEKRFLWCEMS